MPQQREASLQSQLADYMRLQYPRVIFRSDFAAGIKMTKGQAIKHKRMQHGRGYPDFFVAYKLPVYGGLFLELKHPTNDHLPYLASGKLSSYSKIQEQAAVVNALNEAGYYARFAVGFEQAKQIIDWYMRGARKADEPTHDNGTEVQRRKRNPGATPVTDGLTF